jgi:hypothetical protein
MVTSFGQDEQRDHLFVTREAETRYQAFENVHDGWGKKGKRYPLSFLLLLLLLGKMAGETTIEESIGWLHERKNERKRLLHWSK